jgi:hypothetical protein
MNNEDIYYEKYLKYKNKYITRKNDNSLLEKSIETDVLRIRNDLTNSDMRKHKKQQKKVDTE